MSFFAEAVEKIRRGETFFYRNIFFVAAVILAVAISCGFMVWDRSVERDMVGYYEPMARAFAASDWDNAFVTGVPVLQPVLAGVLCRLFPASASAALMFLGCAFFVLTVFPLYGICRRYFSGAWAGIGCCLFVLAPVVSKTSCVGILDAGKVFFLTACLCCVLRIMDRVFLRDYLLLAVSGAGLILIRGEGVLLFALLAAMVGVHALCTVDGRRGLRLLFCACCAVAVLALIAPRGVQMYRCTGVFAVEGRQVRMFHTVLGGPEGKGARNREMRRERPDNTYYAVMEKEPDVFRFSVTDLLRDFSRGAFEVYLPFSLIGVFLVVRRRILLRQTVVLLSTVAATVVIFASICMAHRYFVSNVVCFMPFTLTALSEGIRKLALLEHPRRMTLLVAAAGIFAALCLFDIGRAIYEGYNNIDLAIAQNCRSRFGGIPRIRYFSDEPRFAFFMQRRVYGLEYLPEAASASAGPMLLYVRPRRLAWCREVLGGMASVEVRSLGMRRKKRNLILVNMDDGGIRKRGAEQ